MLQIRNIRKQYRTGDFVQTALDDVSLDLRDSEFVAVLGPSGSGKTTLLNIIGGLDRYDSGDLIINGISTKKYKDKHWDSYRNHSIGFVFQSYNLIPHQTILSNVELALTISGVSKKEIAERRASDELEEIMDNRTQYFRKGDSRKILPAQGTEYFALSAVPILAGGDVSGAVVFIANEKYQEVTDLQKSLTSAGAQFLAKKIE